MYNIGAHPDFASSQVVCNDSGDFCYTEPYPSSDELASFYTQTYRSIRQESPTVDYVRFMQARACAQKLFILEASTKKYFKSILDIGSGCGALLNELNDVGDNLLGYEPDEVMQQYASNTFTGRNMRFVNDAFNPEKSVEHYDLITMSHVLEHIPNPCKFLESICRNALGMESLLFLEVPNDPEYWVSMQVRFQLRGLAHLNYFTAASLCNALNNSGFSILKIRSCGMPLEKFIKLRRPKSRWQRLFQKLSKKTPPALPDYSIPVEINHGIYLQVLAYKPSRVDNHAA